MVRFTLLLLVLVTWLSGTHSAQSNPVQPATIPGGPATITEMKGDVSVISAEGTVAPAHKSETVAPNSTIETRKGSALLAFSDGSQVLMNANTRIIVRLPEEAQGNFLEQLIGKIIAKVKKHAGEQPPFRIGTPSAVITVRGTHFSVTVTKKQRTYVEVFDGVVEVQGLGRGRPVFVRPGYTTQVGLNSSPETPRNSSGEFEGERSDSHSSGGLSDHGSEDRTPRSPTPNEHETPD